MKCKCGNFLITMKEVTEGICDECYTNKEKE